MWQYFPVDLTDNQSMIGKLGSLGWGTLKTNNCDLSMV